MKDWFHLPQCKVTVESKSAGNKTMSSIPVRFCPVLRA